MEREDRSDRYREDGRGRSLRRILDSFSAHLRKSHAVAGPSAAWWNDPVEPAAVPFADLKAEQGRQAELWGEPATMTVLEERERPAEEDPAPVSLHVGSVEKRHTVLGTGLAEKGKTMSPVGIARFLRIGGSVYDGRDEGRWFALPVRKKTVPFQLMRNLATSADDRRASMLSERIGSRRSDGL